MMTDIEFLQTFFLYIFLYFAARIIYGIAFKVSLSLKECIFEILTQIPLFYLFYIGLSIWIRNYMDSFVFYAERFSHDRIKNIFDLFLFGLKKDISTPIFNDLLQFCLFVWGGMLLMVYVKYIIYRSYGLKYPYFYIFNSIAILLLLSVAFYIAQVMEIWKGHLVFFG